MIQSKHITPIMYGIFAYIYITLSLAPEICWIVTVSCAKCSYLSLYLMLVWRFIFYKISHFSTAIWEEKEIHLGIIHTKAKATPLRFYPSCHFLSNKIYQRKFLPFVFAFGPKPLCLNIIVKRCEMNKNFCKSCYAFLNVLLVNHYQKLLDKMNTCMVGKILRF